MWRVSGKESNLWSKVEDEEELRHSQVPEFSEAHVISTFTICTSQIYIYVNPEMGFPSRLYDGKSYFLNCKYRITIVDTLS